MGFTNGIRDNVCPNFAYRTLGVTLRLRGKVNDSPYWPNLPDVSLDGYSTLSSNLPSYGSMSRGTPAFPGLGSSLDWNTTTSGTLPNYGKCITVDLYSNPSWTIEWLQYCTSTTYPSSSTFPCRFIYYLGETSSGTDYFLCENSAGKYQIAYGLQQVLPSYLSFSSTISVARNEWDAIALVYYNSLLYLYVNGTRIGNVSVPINSLLTGSKYADGYWNFFSYNGSRIRETNTCGTNDWAMTINQFDGYMCYCRSSTFARYTGASYTLPTWEWLGF